MKARSVILITCLATGLAFVLFLWGRQGIYFDASVYYLLGEQIAREGLIHFNDATRTFGYPLFIAILWMFSDHSPSTVHFLVFIVQLIIFLGACFLALHVFKRIFQRIELAKLLFAILALNPLLLIYAGVVLSDLISAVLIFVALLLAIYPPDSLNTLTDNILHKTFNSRLVCTFFSFFVAGCATIVRPANLTIVLAVALVWLLRYRLFKDGSARSLLQMIIGFCIPFVPQLVNNYRAYAQFQPLIIRNLYNEQLAWGMQYLKYMTLALPGDAQGLAYANPLWSSNISTPLEFLSTKPLDFLLTLCIHLFMLFDQGFAFPYVTFLDAWHRLPLAIANYIFLFGAITGIVLWICRLRRVPFSRLDLALVGMLAGIVVYLPGYILSAVETRFSLPVYLMLSPFWVYALWQVHIWWIDKNVRMIVLQVAGLIIFLIAALSLSNWLSSEIVRIEVTSKSAVVLGEYKTLASFGVNTDLIGFQIEEKDKIRGGDSLDVLLRWSCKTGSTETLEIEISLVDTNNRIWAQAARSANSRISRCDEWLWGPSAQIKENWGVHLPVTMPAGEYLIVLGLYDRANEQYIVARNASNETLGDRVPLATVSIEKNKSSFTASDLTIEHPYFVDMQEIRLLGYADLPTQIQAGNLLDVGLYWRARGKPKGDYIVTVQLRDSVGNVIGEQTARPAENTYPTTEWNTGEVLLDWHTLTLSGDVQAGEYSVAVRLQDVANTYIIGESQFARISVVR